MIRIGSLFSGIGGLELGVLAALAEARIPARVVWQVEIDPFCRAVLARHFPDADRSVIDVRADAALRFRPVDLVIGGFPCQDVSGAGKGDGLSGERSGLWWAYRDIVRSLRPSAVLVENVASGLRRWHGPVRCSLEALGYRTRARQISAADVDAPHRRERVFVLAYTERLGRQRGEDAGAGCSNTGQEQGDATDIGGTCRMLCAARGGAMADSGCERRGLEPMGDGGSPGACAPCVDERGESLGHTGEPRRKGSGRSRLRRAERAGRSPDAGGRDGEAQRGVGGGADGLPPWVDIPARWPSGRGEEQHPWEAPRTISGREEHRRARLKALGNAVVPAQGREAMRWAMDVLGWEARAA